MQAEDKERFRTIVMSVAELYDKTVSKNALMIWWLALKNFTIQQVEFGISCAVQDPDTGRFMPKPADVIRQIKARAPKQKSPLEAWLIALNAVDNIGYYKSFTFEDNAITTVIYTYGGWMSFCDALDVSEEKLHWIQREFERRYEVFASRETMETESRHMVGFYEREYRLRGQQYEDIKMLCDDGVMRDKQKAITTSDCAEINKIVTTITKTLR
jgi:hypothetical protein